MRKKILIMLFGIVAVGSSQAQSLYYYEDFQSGTPKNMTFYDFDQAAVNSSLNGSGLEDGTWHLLLMGSGESNYFMGSASWFAIPGKANDWMITPKIKIYKEGATLNWKGIVCDNGGPRIKRDGYKIYISTTGNSMRDFETEPIFSIDEENPDKWVSHEVSLDKYVGKQIYIAFVNDSYDKYVLGIDDISVRGPKPAVGYEFTTPTVTDSLKAHVSVKITNNDEQTLDNCKVSYAIDKDTVSQDFTELNLAKGASAELIMTNAIEASTSKTIYYDSWIEPNNDPYLAESDSIMGVYFVANRRTVIEEGTGTWCGNCPLGAAALEYLSKWYPENFIPIAVHDGSGGDGMAVNDYVTFCGFTGFPEGLTDRKFLSTPYGNATDANYTFLNNGFETFFLEAQKQYAVAEINGQAYYTDDAMSKVNVLLTTKFIKDVKNEGYSIALIVLEDSVTAPDGSLFSQHNYFHADVYDGISIYAANDTLEEVAGYANQPEYIAQKFNHVARAAVGDYSGMDPSFPDAIVGNFEYNNPVQFYYEDGLVNNPQFTYLVAMLLDGNGWVVNACKINIGLPTGINGVKTDNGAIDLRANGNTVTVTSETANDMTLNLYSANGAMVTTLGAVAATEHSFTLPANLKGVYIVKATVGKNVITRKLTF